MGEVVGGGNGISAGLAPEVDALLRRATAHPLGCEFIKRGSPDAVSATFGVHAFVVDAAREALRGATASVQVPTLRVSV